MAAGGNEDERRAFRNEVDRAHRQVRSTADDAVRTTCSIRRSNCGSQPVSTGASRLLYGTPDEATADTLYRESARFGTTLQVLASQWPPDWAAFEAYWRRGLESVEMDDATPSSAVAPASSACREGSAPPDAVPLSAEGGGSATGPVQPSLVQAIGGPPRFLGALSGALGAGSIVPSIVSGRLVRRIGAPWLAIAGVVEYALGSALRAIGTLPPGRGRVPCARHRASGPGRRPGSPGHPRKGASE